MTLFKCPKCNNMWTEYELFCLPKDIRRKVLDGKGCSKCKKREENNEKKMD